MDTQQRRDASCRVALAGLGHDLGKFAQRAGLEVPPAHLEGEKVAFCPVRDGRYSHVHAAYTGQAFDAMEAHLPDIKEGDVAPFTSWRDDRAQQRVGDSLVGAAGRHHRPETPLQRMVAVADRLASGLDRSRYDDYNAADEEREEDLGKGTPAKRVNHLRARLWPTLEGATLKPDGGLRPCGHRLPLQPLSPQGLFPKPVDGVVPGDDAKAQREYKALWDAFLAGLQDIPGQHRGHLPLWLDHFDSLLLTFTHAIPSATATKKPGGGFMDIPADVSLYDHAKVTSALAVALWRCHEAADSVAAFSLDHEPKEGEFLLIQGDFFGIQAFLFSGDGSSQKRVAKLLRGRSFMVSLLCELAALRVLEAFDLPPTSQVLNAAGRFLIVAPQLADAQERVARVRRELDAWFLRHTFGRGGMGLATTPAGRKDFERGRFPDLMERLNRDMERRKFRRFDLCAGDDPHVLAAADFSQGVCATDGVAPAVRLLEGENDRGICALCHDQMEMGRFLVGENKSCLAVLRQGKTLPGVSLLELDFLGYRVGFLKWDDVPLYPDALVRLWDFSPPASKEGDQPLWRGLARRAINGHVPADEQGILEFDAIANNSVTPEGKGVAALGVLKGDVDNLGQLFGGQKQHQTFARRAAMSRQLHAFFSLWLPWYCASKHPSTYTVFAGGDDFFLLGPWRDSLALVEEMRNHFAQYTRNQDIHFSAGWSMVKPGLPVPTLAALAERGLAESKTGGKNAITLWNRRVPWERFARLRAAEVDLEERLEDLRDAHQVEVGTGYLYGLLELCDKADEVDKRPESAIWHAWYVYRTWRMVLDRMRQAEEADKRKWDQELARVIGGSIREYRGDFKVALFPVLYQRRGEE
ncbi:MAG: type III-A CRISPR-associated protein Cas10/Csm1 [Magnetococcus sp. WYHC-3]